MSLVYMINFKMDSLLFNLPMTIHSGSFINLSFC